MSNEGLSNLLHEERRFAPPEELAANANVKADAYEAAREDRIAFWETQARRLSWGKEWDTALSWEVPDAKWFDGGELNVAYNCVDRHVEDGHGAIQQRLVFPPKRKIDISSTTQQTILEGLREAAGAPGGTSYDVFKGFPYTVYGKTGTAERGLNPDQSWYVAYVPHRTRPIVVAVTIEKGGFGAETAAPAVRLILANWFDLHETAFKAGSSHTR